MKINLNCKILILGIIVLLIGAVFFPIVNSENIILSNNSLSLASSSFNPFDQGWLYRIKLTINHNKVTGDLLEFPVLVSFTSSHLGRKAQVDGDDILFTNRPGGK